MTLRPRALAALPLLALIGCSTVPTAPTVPVVPGAKAIAPPPRVERLTGSARYVDSKLGIELVRGELRLPARYLRPVVRPAPGVTAVEQLFLVRPKELMPAPRGRSSAAKGGEGASEAARPGPDDVVTWGVVALRRAPARTAWLHLSPERGDPPIRVEWPLEPAAAADREVLREWAQARIVAQDAFGQGDGPLQGPLAAAAVGAYGLDGKRYERLGRPESGAEGEPQPSLLALLGGRAAVDETLQLERALAPDERGDARRTVPMEKVEGIDVKPHPWRELLAGRAGARIPLADCVPADRFLVFLPRPKEAIAGLENGGAGFLRRVSSFARQGEIDYGVVERYLQDLGLGGGIGRRLLAAGAVDSAVLFTSDLSFLSGTEVTVVAEISSLFLPLLPVEEGSITEKETPGGKAFRTRRGSRVFLSTSRAELALALALDAKRGLDSIGRSDELSYLLLQLSPGERTQAFAYLSDPFIRRLLGPAQRIARSRVDRARTEMERLAGAALLRRQDVPGELPTAAGLVALGYLPAGFPVGEYVLLPDGRVSSPTFGPLERLHPAARLDATAATPAEVERYRAFREGYQRYWRRFFDPIAVRLDRAADGAGSLETFILPLLDSSIYRELARTLAPKASARLTVPRWAFPAALELDLQLPEQLVGETRSRGLPDELERATALASGELTAALGSALHVAFPDAAPILQLGGGAAAGVVTEGTGRFGESLLPLAVAAFTRPMVIAVELKDPARARRALELAVSPDAGPARGRRGDVSWRLARDESDRILLTADLFGTVAIRTTLAIEDRWLVAANDATLPPRLIAGSAELGGAAAAVALRPGALRLGLPAAWQAASEAEARSAFGAQHWLAPWLAAGSDPAAAGAASRALLGAAPSTALDLAPGYNGWWNRRFGTPARPLLPPLEPKRDFGLFEGIEEARVEMAFEGDGLRTRVTWRESAGR